MGLRRIFEMLRKIPASVWPVIIGTILWGSKIITRLMNLWRAAQIVEHIESKPEGRKEQPGEVDANGYKQPADTAMATPDQVKDTPTGTATTTIVEVEASGTLTKKEGVDEAAGGSDVTTEDAINFVDQMLEEEKKK